MSEIPEAFARAFAELAWDPQPVVLTMTKVDAWILLAQLQLALRHRDNVGATARRAREIAAGLETAIGTEPALVDVIERGWRGE